MNEDDPTMAEYRALLKDVDRDIASVQQELDELLTTRSFLLEQIEVRKGVTLAQVRDWITDCTGQNLEPATIDEIAQGLGCSVGQLRMKGFLKTLLKQGTIMKVLRDRKVLYQFNYYDHPQVKPKKYKRDTTLRLVGAVPLTGKKNPKVLRRQHKIKGVGD